jgi:hypothetical protein
VTTGRTFVRSSPRDSEELRGLALARPSTSPYALVERVRCEVSAARPADCPALGIDADFGKALRGHCALEYRPSHTVQHVDLAGYTIGKREPQDSVLRNARLDYVWCKPDHCSGSISCSVAPSRARRQFSSSSVECISAQASTSRSSRRGRSLTSTSNVSMRTFALCPAARAWKWGGPWSSKYIVIVSPKKRLIVGIHANTAVSFGRQARPGGDHPEQRRVIRGRAEATRMTALRRDRPNQPDVTNRAHRRIPA